MMKAAAIAALSIPVFCAAADYTADMQDTATQADTWCAHFSQVSDDLKALGVELPAPAPASSQTDSAAADGTTTVTADLGMLFDAASSRIIYLGNVKLQDSRLNLAAREQLHIYLPRISAPQDSGEIPLTAPGKAAAPQAATEEAQEPTTPAPATEPASSTMPASITADLALADTLNNTILVYSPSEGGEIHLQYGDSKVHITSATASKAPRLLADQQGNILLEGDQILVSMIDKQGATSELCTRGGAIYYHAASSTLYAPGSSTLSHPDGTLTCSEMLCIKLRTATPAPAAKNSFMSQFTGLKFDGIDSATARGQVIATRKAGENAPAAEVHGEELSYNGQSGECALTGTACKLVYDQYQVNTNNGIHLLPNGDIELRGSDINGHYTRQGSTPGTTLRGTFKANANVIFRADLGTISTAEGIALADDEADFSCTGPVNLVLVRKEGATVPERKPGMPNLAITQYGDIARARAEGNVTAHRYEPGTRKCLGELQSQMVETDLTTGETLLTGAQDTELVAHYNGNRLAAMPAAGKAATVELRNNGDIRLNGAHLSAEILNDEGTTKAECQDYVMLVRAENRLETGSATRLQTDKAILTTTGPLQAYLVADESATAPAKGKFTGLRFNYTGIREASTESGCTVRTEKGSMQCTGPVRLLMSEQKGKDKMLGGLVRATASGNVAVAGKDNTGRLFRATGDFLDVDNTTGMKVLSGSKVTLADANNTHTASGKGAAIRIDAGNNASITGEKHTTSATNIKQQINNPTFKK